MAVIFIKDLVVSGVHGVHQHEKTAAQQFRINAELEVDISVAAASDELADTLDWSVLRQTVIEVVEELPFNLVEKLTHEIATALLADERVSKVRVTVDKLEAFESGLVGVELELGRD